jgi:hypothetical protein
MHCSSINTAQSTVDIPLTFTIHLPSEHSIMKRFTFIMLPLLALIIMSGCGNKATDGGDCGEYEGHQLYREGDECFYYLDNERWYVSLTACNCD